MCAMKNQGHPPQKGGSKPTPCQKAEPISEKKPEPKKNPPAAPGIKPTK